MDAGRSGPAVDEGCAVVNLRRWRVTRLLVAAMGSSMTSEARLKRINARMGELTEDVPALRSLRASKIMTLNELSDSGMYLGVHLEETPQMSLSLPTEKSEQSVLTDLFLQDIERVKSEQEKIGQQISRAMSPALDPSSDNKMSKIRRRLKSNRGKDGFLVPNGPEPEVLHIDSLPKVLPRGYGLETLVRVNWLSPKKAEVTVHAAINVEGGDTMRLLPNTKLELMRSGIHRRPESGRRLQQAMDTKRDLKLSVTLTLSWASGEPQYLELVAFVDD